MGLGVILCVPSEQETFVQFPIEIKITSPPSNCINDRNTMGEITVPRRPFVTKENGDIYLEDNRIHITFHEPQNNCPKAVAITSSHTFSDVTSL